MSSVVFVNVPLRPLPEGGSRLLTASWHKDGPYTVDIKDVQPPGIARDLHTVKFTRLCEVLRYCGDIVASEELGIFYHTTEEAARLNGQTR